MSKRARVSSRGWLDKRTGLRRRIEHYFETPVPKRSYKRLYSLGAVAVMLLIVQVITGVMLAFYYQPTPEKAYDSIVTIMEKVRLGAAIRNIHHWSANLLVISVALHLLQIFYKATYKSPRELLWITGMILLFLILVSAFTGYLLPWDARAYWATKVEGELLKKIPLVGSFLVELSWGGDEISERSLSRYYATHILLLPLLILLFLRLHLLLLFPLRVPKAASSDD